MDDEFGEAMLPLSEIAEEEEKVELTKDILNYVAKVMAVHNKRLDDKKIKEALNPVFNKRTENMIMTIFEEKYWTGKSEGRNEGAALSVQSVLSARFHTVSRNNFQQSPTCRVWKILLGRRQFVLR